MAGRRGARIARRVRCIADARARAAAGIHSVGLEDPRARIMDARFPTRLSHVYKFYANVIDYARVLLNLVASVTIVAGWPVTSAALIFGCARRRGGSCSRRRGGAYLRWWGRVCVGGGVGEADGVPRLWGPWF